ncbi:hypothetical protein GCM10018966_025630 [Streptomyces yanii]
MLRGGTCPSGTARGETVYGLFRRWQRDGTWHRIVERLQARADAEGLITWDVSVDSTIARAHQHAAGARKRGICRSNRQAVSSPSPTTTGSTLPGRADTKLHLAVELGPEADVTGDHGRATW